MARRGRRGGKKKWIQGAIGEKGALHRQMGVPEGEKIPEAKLESAANSSDELLAKRARLAMTLKGFNHKHGRGKSA